jgi:arginyl-tRNA synthetase
MLFTSLLQSLVACLDELVVDGRLPAGLTYSGVVIEPPRDPSHGDIATNVAMVLAKPARTNPRALAEFLVPKLSALPEVASANVAGPGFINLSLNPQVWRDELADIHAQGTDYGRSALGTGQRVNVEFVSANPTGPMHMGHCRGAVVGDALATLLEYAGYAVTREYYVNDAGGQVDVLARSVHLRYREALGEDVGAIPEGLYPGDYLIPLGQALAKAHGDKFVGKPEAEWLALFREQAVAAMMDLIRADLALLGIRHDVFASEAAIRDAGRVNDMLAALEQRQLVYTGTLEAPRGYVSEDWEPRPLLLFKATQFGDDGDRPLKKASGEWTYFAGDIAYHYDKAQRADMLIDIWGADHAGTTKRIKAAVAALTDNKVPFDIPLVQMVRLMRNGELVRMGKRLGNFVTLADMVEEVGKDVVRFTMLTRKADAQMDFDFAKVVEASKDNPVFYVQYAHARICSLARKAKELGLEVSGTPDLTLLMPDDLNLIKLAAQFPRVVEAAATHHEPHRIAFYLYELAAAFHAHWHLGNDSPEKRVLVVNNAPLTISRLFMAAAIGQVIANGLLIMGVQAATEM